VVAPKNKRHTELIDGKNETFDANAGLGVLLKVKISGKQPPLVVKFKYDNSDTPVQCYYSFEVPEPGAGTKSTVQVSKVSIYADSKAKTLIHRRETSRSQHLV
jgi:hypothetical protein